MLPIAPEGNPPTIAEQARLSQPLFGRPYSKPLFSLVCAERALVESKFEQETPGVSDCPARADSKNRHDLLSVKIRADRIELFARTDVNDSRFQIVVGLAHSDESTLVSRCDVTPNQNVKPAEFVTGVSNVTANRRIRPRPFAVSEKPQVQSDEIDGPSDGVAIETEGGEAFLRHPRANNVVAVKRDCLRWFVE